MGELFIRVGENLVEYRVKAGPGNPDREIVQLLGLDERQFGVSKREIGWSIIPRNPVNQLTINELESEESKNPPYVQHRRIQDWRREKSACFTSEAYSFWWNRSLYYDSRRKARRRNVGLQEVAESFAKREIVHRSNKLIMDMEGNMVYFSLVFLMPIIPSTVFHRNSHLVPWPRNSSEWWGAFR